MYTLEALENKGMTLKKKKYKQSYLFINIDIHIVVYKASNMITSFSSS